MIDDQPIDLVQMQNHHLVQEKSAEVKSLACTATKPQEQTVHPLLIPSLVGLLSSERAG